MFSSLGFVCNLELFKNLYLNFYSSDPDNGTVSISYRAIYSRAQKSNIPSHTLISFTILDFRVMDSVT